MHIAPPTVHAVADAVLAGLPEHQQELFGLAWTGGGTTCTAGCPRCIPTLRWPDLELRLVRQAAAAFRDREPDLHRLDRVAPSIRTGSSSQRCSGYAAYADRFAGDLAGIARRGSPTSTSSASPTCI